MARLKQVANSSIGLALVASYNGIDAPGADAIRISTPSNLFPAPGLSLR
jgi:hypothetical protein